jgi:hypothetical protein
MGLHHCHIAARNQLATFCLRLGNCVGVFIATPVDTVLCPNGTHQKQGCCRNQKNYFHAVSTQQGAGLVGQYALKNIKLKIPPKVYQR